MQLVADQSGCDEATGNVKQLRQIATATCAPRARDVKSPMCVHLKHLKR